MPRVHGQESNVHFGRVNAPPPDWREDMALLSEEDPDDELLAETPPDVVAMLGFDPLDYWKKSAELD